ncbi:MAG TPA: carbonic anhydrase [Candidatus Saccharimonadales bacterium]|nr:carbonic anhydrase [Candidatus Saccharimonadales bacterium]
MMKSGKFATAINCMDGRVQTPVLDWIKLHLNVDYVDLITEPGPDKALSLSTDLRARIFEKVCFSLKAHNPIAIAIAGHWDCIANPVAREEHLDQIREGVRIIEGWRLRRRTLGLWVNEWGYVDLISDTEGGREVISYSFDYSV